MNLDLFDAVPDQRPARQQMAEGAVLLRGYAKPAEGELIAALHDLVAQAPFRHMQTPGGHQMSVAMTNCGDLGWVTHLFHTACRAAEERRARADLVYHHGTRTRNACLCGHSGHLPACLLSEA